MPEIIDANVSLFGWPFRRLPGSDTAELVAKLREHGVTRAWAGSFEGVFQRDVAGVNDRLAQECRERGDGMLVPFGTVNPLLPDWEEDLRRCHETHRMPGIRLYPNYHGYALDHAECAKLLAAAAERRVVVQMVVTLEDERTQPALARVPHVDTRPFVGLVGQLPDLRVVLLNAFQGVPIEQVGRLAAAGRVWFDIAMLERVGGVARLAEQVGPERVLFGSHYPFFYFESALLKMRESPLDELDRRAILFGNARGLLEPT